MTTPCSSSHPLAATETLRFLQTWFARCPVGELLEVRPLHRGGRPLARTWCDSIDEAFDRVSDCTQHGDDVYIGALPRARRGGKATDVGSRVWLWADIDYGVAGHATPAPHTTREEALAAIDSVGVSPTLLTETGGGFHAWYALDRSVSEDDWSEAIARLTFTLQADPNALDPPRILRVGGSLNFKTEKPRRVRLLRAEEVAHPVAVFIALPPQLRSPSPASAQTFAASPKDGEGRTTDRPFDRANAVPMSEVLAWLGIPVHAEGSRTYCACPAHEGTNASQMVVGGTSNSAHCFGDCQRSYTPVDLVAAARGVSAREAVNILGERFGFDGFSNVVPLRSKGRERAQETLAPEPLPQSPLDEAASHLKPALARGDQLEVAVLTLDLLRKGGPVTFDEGDFYRYDANAGLWRRLDSEHVAFTASSFAGSRIGAKDRPLLISDSALRGIVNISRIILLNDEGRARFGSLRRGIAFQNGFVQVANGRVSLLGHAPEHMCRYVYPFDFDEAAPTPRLDTFLAELFEDVSEGDEAERRKALVQEFAGACLTGIATQYQKLLVLYGHGNNGKSELLRLLRALFPPSAIASLPPQEWGERFKLARLVGVLANFVDEIPERDIVTGEVFKSVVTGDPVSAERKNRDPFDYRPIAGHILAANALPGTVDQSDGYWRRFLLCPLTRDFSSTKARRINAAQDVIEHELPGVAAWALRGAARLLEAGAYTPTAGGAAALSEWREEADPVHRFATERNEPAGHIQPASTLYEHWRVWARQNGFADMSSTRFGRRLAATGVYRRERDRNGRKYVRLGKEVA